MAMAVVYTTFAGQIVSENRGGVVKEYLTDTLGSTIALATEDAITDSWDYWPYGEVMSRTGTTPTPFTFVGTLGYFKDLLDKLFYVRARHYQPNYGRWLTVDPFWPEESAYGYARTDPIGLTDVSGATSNQQGQWVSGPPRKLPRNTGQDCGGGPGFRCINLPCWNCLKGIHARGLQWEAERRRRTPPMSESWYNAMRHCVASCLAVESCGCDCAHNPDLRESGGVSPPTVDNICDLFNNRYGRFLGTQVGNCPDLCARAFREGNLCGSYFDPKGIR